MNARLWVWYQGGPVKLTINPDDCLTYGYSEACDEGHHYESECLEYVADEGKVYRTSDSGGRDCDGRIDYTSRLECPIMHLRKHEGTDGFMFPLWSEVDSSQRDYSAEAMGY